MARVHDYTSYLSHLHQSTVNNVLLFLTYISTAENTPIFCQDAPGENNPAALLRNKAFGLEGTIEMSFLRHSVTHSLGQRHLVSILDLRTEVTKHLYFPCPILVLALKVQMLGNPFILGQSSFLKCGLDFRSPEC